MRHFDKTVSYPVINTVEIFSLNRLWRSHTAKSVKNVKMTTLRRSKKWSFTTRVHATVWPTVFTEMTVFTNHLWKSRFCKKCMKMTEKYWDPFWNCQKWLSYNGSLGLGLTKTARFSHFSCFSEIKCSTVRKQRLFGSSLLEMSLNHGISKTFIYPHPKAIHPFSRCWGKKCQNGHISMKMAKMSWKTAILTKPC